MDVLRDAVGSGDAAQMAAAYKALLGRRPTDGTLWTAYCRHLYAGRCFDELERAFSTALRTVLDVRLWLLYLQHVVAINVGNADHAVTLQAFEFAVNTVGLDVHSFPIWHGYVDVVRALPTLEPFARTELLRKIYSRALQIPMDRLEVLWAEYDGLEQSTGRQTAKKMIADRSPAYMAARAQIKTLLDLSAYGDGQPQDDATAASLLGWAYWERSNPLNSDKATVNARVMYAYRKMLMTLRHEPIAWLSMVEFCEEQAVVLGNAAWFGKGSAEEHLAVGLLRQAVEANPTSLELTVALVERLEVDKKGADRSREAARGLFESLAERLEARLEGLGDYSALDAASACIAERLSLCHVHWMSHVRRTDGLPAARAVFTRARKHALCGPAVFSASAWMEFWHGSKDELLIAGRIFELGMAKFATHSVDYVLEYLQFLQNTRDDANLRAVLEKALIQLGKERNLPLWKFYLGYEALAGGDMALLRALEKRVLEQHPSVGPTELFQHRTGCLGGRAVEGGGIGLLRLAQQPREATAPREPRPAAAVPGWIPQLAMQLLVQLHVVAPRFDESAKVSFDVLADLLGKYPPAAGWAVPQNGHRAALAEPAHAKRSHGGGRHSDAARPKRALPEPPSSAPKKGRHHRSAYDDIFEDGKRSRRRK